MKRMLSLLAFCATLLSVNAETYKVPATEQYPYYYSVDVPDGNYRVTVVLGSKKKATETCVRAENRRLFEQKVVLKKGQTQTFSFIVNKRSVDIPAYIVGDMERPASKVKIKPGEWGSCSWCDRLTR